jgi:hypothetical protein
MEFGVRIAHENSNELFLRLHWSPFKQEMVGQNSLEGDELVVFNLAIGFFENEHEIFIDKIDLIRVLNLNTLSVQAVAESQWSWKLRIGTDRIVENSEHRYDGVVSFGAGRAWKWNETIICYGMVDLAAHTLSPFVRARPHLGLIFNFGKLRTWLYFGAESVDYDPEFHDVWGGKIHYRLTDQYAVQIEFSNEMATRTSVGLNWYW